MDKLLAGVLVVITGVLLGALFVVLYGIAFMFIWNYIAPVYWPAAPQLTLIQAIATTTIIALIRPIPTGSKGKK